ncbi:MAG: DUF2781 domain-containing protein [Rhodothermia bacterium]|nr:DUF2781 domain-containing protein [Rhodothermia bacterium]NNE35494.1 DUF2781 domain-containing protein [Rhodothermales bacterium]
MMYDSTDSDLERMYRRTKILDALIVSFFVFNLVFVTGMISPIQILYDDLTAIAYRPWPPSFVVEWVQWWGASFDPTLMTRPVWRLTTAWIDVLLFGPFYLAAVYAFVGRRNWIRAPALMYAAVMLTNVTIIMSESSFGSVQAPFPFIVLGVFSPWIVFPVVVVIRMTKPTPFSE